MGISLLVAFLVTSNTNGLAFADVKNLVCANTVKMTLSGLPNQTNPVSSAVVLKNLSPNKDHGYTNINIPGIGSGVVTIDFDHDTNGYTVATEGFPGQEGGAFSFLFMDKGTCFQPSGSLHGVISISGIGDGSIELTKVN